jgi:excisionase family DNA binding protein
MGSTVSCTRAVQAGQSYLTIEGVAKFAHCSVKTVRRAIAARELQAFKPGARLVVRQEDARKWIESRPARSSESRSRPSDGLFSKPRDRAREQAGSVSRLRQIEREATP